MSFLPLMTRFGFHTIPPCQHLHSFGLDQYSKSLTMYVFFTLSLWWYQSLYCLFSLFSLESITLFLFSFAFIFCFCFSLSRNLRQRGKFSLTTSKSGSPFLRYTLPESLFTLFLCRLAPGWCPTNSLYHYCVDSLCLFLSVGSLVSWIPNLPLVLLPLWVVSL